MQLTLNRDQAEKAGIFGRKMVFQINFKVDLTPAEQEIVNRYKAHKEVIALIPPMEWFNSAQADVALKAVKKLGYGSAGPRRLTIRDFIAGQAYEFEDVFLMNAIEAEVKQGCAAFKAYLDEVSGVGKKEAIEF